MKLLLPDYDYKFPDGSAEIRDKVLYFYRPGAFDDVMYQLTYMIFGKKECYFCHRPFLDLNEPYSPDSIYVTQTTLDHLYSQTRGGSTITNNLRPTCSRCNALKGKMCEDEFRQYLEIMQSTDSQKAMLLEEFRQECDEREKRWKKGEYEYLPVDWFTQDQIQNIYASIWIREPLGAEFYRKEKILRKLKFLPFVVVVTRNRFLLSGFNTIMIAKKHHISKVRVMVLENTEYHGFPISKEESIIV